MTKEVTPRERVAATPVRSDPWWWRLVPTLLRRWLAERFGDLEPRVRRGYWVWLAIGVVIAIPEIWAAAAKPPWPTISGTVGHLETRWDFVAVIVVAAIAIIAAHAIRLPLTDRSASLRQADGRILRRTAGGRLTQDVDDDRELRPLFYFLPALACIAGGSALASALSDNKWVLGYVIYGLIGIFGVLIPSALAYGRTPDAPFAGIFPTVADLQRRLHFVAMTLLAGLVVLLIHLAFYPWPDVFRHHPGTGSP